MSEVKTRRRAIDKKARVPFGGKRTKLQLSDADMRRFKERNMHVHWINDKDGNVEQALQAGYTFVDPEHARSLGASDIHQENTDLNDRVSKVVSRGGGESFRAYLMEQNLDWYNEDRENHEKTVNARVDEALRPAEQGGRSIESGYTPG